MSGLASGAEKQVAGAARFLKGATIVLTLIAAAAVLHRFIALFTPLRSAGPMAGADGVFLANRALTLGHISLGMLYLGLAPFQFARGLRSRRPELHRAMGRATLAIGLGTGVTALGMASRASIGGLNESAAAVVFASLFLGSLVMGWRSILRGAVAQHREWMLRAYSIALAIATIRPIIAILFVATASSGLSPRDFFGTGFWIGFTLHLAAAQVWIDWTRPRMPRTPEDL
jgi:uncharacterized membrane protein YozB (DUF420 family)